jgi:hypothetical protein
VCAALLVVAGLSRGCGAEEQSDGSTSDLDASSDAGRDVRSKDRAEDDRAFEQPMVEDGGDAVPPDMAPEAADAGVGDAGCPAFTRPAAVPADWEEYTDWSCGCRFWIPGAKGQMPPPIQWEPCPPPAPQNMVCERMKTTWTSLGFGIAARPRFWLDIHTGAPVIAFKRIYVNDDINLRSPMIAEADGKVRLAFFQANPANKGCEVTPDDLADNRFAFTVIGNTWSGQLDGNHEGLIAGDIDDPHPPVKFKLKNDPSSWTGWGISSSWMLQLKHTVIAHSWDLKTSVEVYSPAKDPEGMPAHNVMATGPDVFWEVDVSGYSGVMSWNQLDGARPLLRWYGDWTRGAGNFRTDGKDMVWTYGEGKAPQDKYKYIYPKLSVMTAPYTSDPAVAQAKARRLRSDLSAFSVWPYGVGCGHAVRVAGIAEDGGGRIVLLIVRLSDGASWVVKDAPVPDQHGFLPAMAIGASCDHVYFDGESKEQLSSIFRIRLDSLGPPLAPD